MTVDLRSRPPLPKVLVDPEDEHLLARGFSLNGSGYVNVSGGVLHRLIVACPIGLEVHHKNHNKLDNRRVNLEIVTHQQNHQRGSIRSDNTFGHKGVTFNKKTQKWKAQLHYYGCIYLGEFDKIEDAIAARKRGEELYFK